MTFKIWLKINSPSVIDSFDILSDRAPEHDIYESVVIDMTRQELAGEIDSRDDEGELLHKFLYPMLKIIDPRLDLFSNYLMNPETLRRICNTFSHIDERAQIYNKIMALKIACEEYDKQKRETLRIIKIRSITRTFDEVGKPKIPSAPDSSKVSPNLLRLPDIDDYLIRFLIDEQDK